MTLESAFNEEAKFVESRSWFSRWWSSRSWWDWACHVPKAKAVKHKSEFKEGEETKGGLKVKKYGPVRRTVGLVGRLAEATALYTAMGVAYILSAEANPRLTHDLTDWASPVVVNVQREGARALDWGDALVNGRWPSDMPLSDRFNQNKVSGGAGVFSPPLAYAILAEKSLEGPVSVRNVEQIYSFYSIEDVERIGQNCKIPPTMLASLAGKQIPAEIIINPSRLGFSSKAPLDKFHLAYFDLLSNYGLDDIRKVREVVDRRFEEALSVQSAFVNCKRNGISVDEFYAFKGYSIHSIFTIKRLLTQKQQDEFLALKPSAKLVDVLITDNTYWNGTAQIYFDNFIESLSNPVFQKAAEAGRETRGLVRYLSVYAEVNGLDSVNRLEPYVRDIVENGKAFNWNTNNIIYTPERLAKLGIDKPLAKFNLLNSYFKTQDIAKLIDNGVDLDFAIKYGDANHKPNSMPDVTFEDCYKAFQARSE